jgi:hypothetical protein
MSKHNPLISATVPHEVKEAIESIAEERQRYSQKNVYPSDIIREAIQDYFDKLGIDLQVKADRGGDRIQRD